MNYEKLYIGGEWIEPISKEKIQVENPADKSILGYVPAGGEDDVNMAVAAAKEAFKTWQFSAVDERKQLLINLIPQLEKRVDQMADTISKELGCGVKFAKSMHVLPYIKDVRDYLDMVDNYPFEEKFDEYLVRREPIGIVGAITPWNYPLGQIMKKLSPSVLGGNVMVLKPSQKTPLVAFLLAEAIHEAGFPKGVFNLVSGRGSEVGNVLATHRDVNLITFTGSTNGGLDVARLAIDDFKRLSLELGGKSPAIVLKSADYKVALKKTLDKVYLNTGQSCSAYSRLFVPREEKEEIENLIIEMTKEYKFGDPKDPEVIIGPVANRKQFEKVKYYIERGVQEGAKLLIGEVPKESYGYYIGPTVFTDVDNKMEIAQNEIFGPVLCVIPYDTVEDAIQMANDSVYGLSGGVFGQWEEAYEVAKRLRTGTLVMNNGNQLHRAPFGGFKHSGFGREGGKFGLDEFVEVKALFV